MGTYRNPILPGCHPDPSICRVGDAYYLVTSTFEYLPGLPIHRSTNLVDWQLIGHAIHRPEQLEGDCGLDFAPIPSSKGLYAPTIRHHAGRFYVVCTHVAGAGHPLARSGHFVVTADDPAGPWSEPVWFDGMPGIDPSLTFDGDRLWLCATAPAAGDAWTGANAVWLAELDPETFAPLGERTAIWTGALDGAGWAEAPHILPHPDGGWLLVAAEGGTDRDHSVCVAYADQITGPYRGDPGNPRLTHRHLGARAPIANVGHADLVEAPDGRTWAVALATRTDAGTDALTARQTVLVPVEWQAGRPVFAPGSGRVEAVVEAEGVADQQPWPDLVRDDFDAPALDLAWNGVRRLPSAFADAGARPGFVRLTATSDEPSQVGATSFLARRLPDSRVDVRTVVELSAGEGALRAGLLLRTSELGFVELSVDRAGRVRAVLEDSGRTIELGSTTLPAGAPVALAMRVEGFCVELIAAGFVVATADVRGVLTTGRTSWFVGTWVGPFAVGEGVADVDVVELRTRA
ncbi:family 43 glycosylhydrolase [Microbacterium sp. BWT-B31]|uniref:glycoside hydrolase family 43 protein n=1 Tax=Microbacterium sp. BWT-B31 TaxID=3232072 RepID=UPI003526F1B5